MIRFGEPLPEAIMEPIASLHSTRKAWLINSKLATRIDVFFAHLRRGRDAVDRTVRVKIRGLPRLDLAP